MKKIFVLILMLFSLLIFENSIAQFKIGNISLRDSNRVLVVTAPASFWGTNWLTLASLPTTIAGDGLSWDNSTGISILVGDGLKIENDTLKTDLTTILTTNDTTIYINSSGQVSLRVAPNYGLTKDLTGLAIDLSTNSGLTFSGNSLTTNLDSGITVSGNKLKIKTDASVVGFDGSGNLKILPNSITETQISKDINLDSIKIGGITVKFEDDKINVGDSITVGKMVIGAFGGDYIRNGTLTSYWDESNMALTINGDINIDNSVGGPYEFKINAISINDKGTLSNVVYKNDTTNFTEDISFKSRLLTAKSDTGFITTDSVITVSNGNFAVVSDSASIGRLYYMTTTGWTAGSMLTLYFTGALAIGHAKPDAPANTVPFYLKLTEEFTTADTDILTVIYDGTYWREISRIDNTP